MLNAEELRQIRRLHLQASRKVDNPFAGSYRSAFRGRGMEFEEVRPYTPGDDIRHIDWNVTARTGEPFVKEFREERELTLLLVMDVSGSTRFGSGGRDGRTDKRLQIARLAGALAFAAVRNGDRVGLVSFTDRVERFLPPRKSRGHAWAVLQAAFEHHDQRRATDLAETLDFVGRVLRRRAVVNVVSDFMAPKPWDRSLAALSRRHQVSCFMVHDPLESALPNVGLLEIEDAETGQRRLVDTSRSRGAASEAERIARLRRAGAWARAVRTDEDPFFQLLLHFKSMERVR